MVVLATLCLIRNDDRILLIKKSRGFGMGKWNLPGGRMFPQEAPEECALREVREETGLNLKELRYHGVLYFYAGSDGPAWTVHIFSTNRFDGEVVETGEGFLRWFDIEKIPYSEMWEDDAHWLPVLVQGKNFEGKFYFTPDWVRLVKHELEVLSSDDESRR